MNRQLVVAVGLIEYQGKFLLTRRVSPKHPQWHHRFELPGGKINPKETPLHALHREIFEETNLKVVQPLLLGCYTHHWQVEDGIQQTFILLYHCIAENQKVLLKPDESDAYIWEDLDAIIKMDNLLDGTVLMLQELYLKERVLYGY